MSIRPVIQGSEPGRVAPWQSRVRRAGMWTRGSVAHKEGARCTAFARYEVIAPESQEAQSLVRRTSRRIYPGRVAHDW